MVKEIQMLPELLTVVDIGDTDWEKEQTLSDSNLRLVLCNTLGDTSNSAGSCGGGDGRGSCDGGLKVTVMYYLQ